MLGRSNSSLASFNIRGRQCERGGGLVQDFLVLPLAFHSSQRLLVFSRFLLLNIVAAIGLCYSHEIGSFQFTDVGSMTAVHRGMAKFRNVRTQL